MNNNILNQSSFFNGLNLNPIPLEMSQSMTTTKWLMGMEHKLSTIIDDINKWYDTIIVDLEGNGALYEKLNEQFLSTFGSAITTIENNVTTINSTISNLSDLITALEYFKPIVSITSSPSTTLFAVGETINSIMINFNIVKGSNDLIKAEIYKNGTLLTTINNPLNGSNSYVDGSAITTDTSYYVKVYDDSNNAISNEIKFTFKYKIFYGKITENTVINEPLILTLNNAIFSEDLNYDILSLNDEKIIIATQDTLKSIIDSDNFDMIESFTFSTITLNINNVATQYNVYVSTNPILDTNVKIIIEK